MTARHGLARKSISTRILATLLVAAFLPLTIVTWLSIAHVDQVLVVQDREQLAQAARAFGASAQRRVLAADETLRDAMRILRQGATFDDALSARLATSFSAVGQLRSDGAVRSLVGFVRSVPALPDGVEERLALGKLTLIVSPRAGQPAMLHLVHAMDLTQPSRTLLLGELKLDYVWGPADATPSPIAICVVGQAGELIRCPNGLPGAQVDALQAQASKGETGSLDWERSDGRFIGSYQALATDPQWFGSRWIVLASRPGSATAEPRLRLARVLIPVLAVSALLVIVLSVVQIRRILAPLNRLIEGARGLTGDDFARRGDVSTEDELGELSASFDRLARKLRRESDLRTALAAIDRQLLGSIDLEQIVTQVLALTQDTVPAQAVLAALKPDPQSGAASIYLRDKASAGETKRSNAPFLPVLGERRLKSTDGVWLDAVPAGDPLLGPLAQCGPSRLFVVPIVLNGTLSAILALGMTVGSTLGPQELCCVRELADRLGVALSAAIRERQLLVQASVDRLTGLPNRASLMASLTQELAQAKRQGTMIAVMLVDIDRFKSVNETLGHAAGDNVIREAAQRIKACLRATDTVARIGADEFAVVVPTMGGSAAATRVANEIRKCFAEPFLSKDNQRYLGVSVGLAVYPMDGESSETLLRNADTAVHRAKETGHGKVVLFEQRMNEELTHQVAVERELRRAIEHDEFVLFYQPQMDVRSGELRGAEVLIRWQHPMRGLLSPAAFIGVAEQTSLIEPIGEIVLRKACLQMQQWRAEGTAPARISVNVSGQQFKRRDFVAQVLSTLRATDLPATALELEITETLLMEDAESAGVVLKKLSERGVRLAIDDFGTGYSSLAYLKRLRIDALKIDRSFVHDVGSDEDSRVIISAITAMAQTLRKEVVAEGVETQEQLDFLRELRCDLIQGYLISKPVPADQFIASLRASVNRTRSALRLASRA